jgi:adenylate kinase
MPLTDQLKMAGTARRCGKPLQPRDDDKTEVVTERLSVYHGQTEPLIKYYGDMVVGVNGTGTVEEVIKIYLISWVLMNYEVLY